MSAVRVSPKYQIVIPREVREAMNIRPGDKIQVLRIGSRLELIPMKNVKSLRGCWQGMNLDGYREEQDRDV